MTAVWGLNNWRGGCDELLGGARKKRGLLLLL